MGPAAASAERQRQGTDGRGTTGEPCLRRFPVRGTSGRGKTSEGDARGSSAKGRRGKLNVHPKCGEGERGEADAEHQADFSRASLHGPTAIPALPNSGAWPSARASL